MLPLEPFVKAHNDELKVKKKECAVVLVPTLLMLCSWFPTGILERPL